MENTEFEILRRKLWIDSFNRTIHLWSNDEAIRVANKILAAYDKRFEGATVDSK